jgi:hypothetical protein
MFQRLHVATQQQQRRHMVQCTACFRWCEVQHRDLPVGPTRTTACTSLLLWHCSHMFRTPQHSPWAHLCLHETLTVVHMSVVAPTQNLRTAQMWAVHLTIHVAGAELHTISLPPGSWRAAQLVGCLSICDCVLQAARASSSWTCREEGMACLAPGAACPPSPSGQALAASAPAPGSTAHVLKLSLEADSGGQ